MTNADFESFMTMCGGDYLRYRKTLRETSMTNDGRYCLERGFASEIDVLWLEGLINDWMDVNGRLARKEPCPSTVDALYVDGDSWHLIEFKMNEKSTLNQMKSKLMYKAYDSVLQLVEHGLRTVTQVRSHDSYIVVATKVGGYSNEEIRLLVETQGAENCDLYDEAINGVSTDVLLRPWAVDVPQVDANLDRLNTVLYRTALTLTPEQFNRFARENNWR